MWQANGICSKYMYGELWICWTGAWRFLDTTKRCNCVLPTSKVFSQVLDFESHKSTFLSTSLNFRSLNKLLEQIIVNHLALALFSERKGIYISDIDCMKRWQKQPTLCVANFGTLLRSSNSAKYFILEIWNLKSK